MAAAGLTQTRTARPHTTMTSSLRPRRRPWLLVTGLLAMVVSAGAFALVYLGSDARVQVLAVTRPVAAGQALSGADLRVVRIVPGAGVDVVRAAESSRVIGHTAAVPLVAGSLLASAQVGPAVWPPAGQVVVAVPVKVGRLAEGVTGGAHVLVIPVTPATSPGAVQGTVVQPLATGVVVTVAPGADGSGMNVVSLLLPQNVAASVASSSVDLSLALARG